jgi:hypothetical protein
MHRNLFFVVCLAFGLFLVGCSGSNEAYRPDMTPPDKKPELQMSSPAGDQAGGGNVRQGAPMKGE